MKALVSSLLLVSVLFAQDHEKNMVKLHVDPFTVVGFETRTTNAQEMTGHGPISQLWSRLAAEHFDSRIQHRVDTHILAVYSSYESDKDGPYSYLLGAKVSSEKDIPAGMVARHIVPGTYAVFTAEGSAPAELVVGLWKRIWALETPGRLQRAYQTDYEIHYPVPNAPANEHADVYIGLRDKR